MTSILTVLGIFLVGQFLEGNVLSPKLVGESVGLHPVWLMFALLAFGYLFGFVGLLVAVPLAATIGVLARFALRRYLRKLALHRRRTALSRRWPVAVARRVSSCLRSTMPKASRARIFWPGRRMPPALALIERWPDWPVAARWRWSARRARAKAISPRSGRRRPARACCRPALLGETDLPAALATGALVVEDLARGASTSARCFICSISRARSAPMC